MYKEVYGPDCFAADGPEKLDWPVCNRETWIALCNLAMGVARRNEERHMPGGAWMNQGFTSATPENAARGGLRPEDVELAFMEVYVPDLPSHPAVRPATEASNPSVTGQTPAPATPA
mgnify:CR=1 FL=1